MSTRKLKRILTIVLLVMLGVAAAAGGAKLGQIYGSPLDNDASISAESVLDKINALAPKSKYNVLLMGTDASGYLTDVMMIYQIDPQLKKVNVLSIPRDTRILFNGRTEKINAAHSYGKQIKLEDGSDRGDEYAIRAVKALTGIPIHHYICINTTAFRQVIDAIDGFDFDVPQDMDYDDDWQELHIHLKKGFQHLDGDKAEQLVRFRHYRDGDIDRVRVQQDVLKALIKQKVKTTYLTQVGSIFSLILQNIDTDMSPSQAMGMASNILAANGSEDGIQTYMIDGDFGNINKLSYWIPNMKLVEQRVAETFGYSKGQEIVPSREND